MTELLRHASMDARADNPAATVDQDAAQRIVDCGLGPLFWGRIESGHVRADPAAGPLLQAADLTSRVLCGRWQQGLEQTLGWLAEVPCHPVLLKGADCALRFYPFSHWRIMRDIDLLVDPSRVEDAQARLIAAGFRNPTPRPESDWDGHHHMTPLYHDELEIWVEMHHALFPQYSPFRREPLLQPGAEPRREVRVGGQSVGVLDDTACFLYTACHWYGSLIEDYGEPGQQRGLIDGMMILRGGQVDEQRLESTRLPEARQALAHFLACGRQAGLFQRPALERRLPAPRGPVMLQWLDQRYLLGLRTPRFNLTRQIAGDAYERALGTGGATGYALEMAGAAARRCLAAAWSRVTGRPAGPTW